MESYCGDSTNSTALSCQVYQCRSGRAEGDPMEACQSAIDDFCTANPRYDGNNDGVDDC